VSEAQVLAAMEARARAAEARLAWEEAAGVWALIADRLGQAGDAERAGRAWDAAGEAWRRDDRPALADKALATAAGLVFDPALGAVIRVKRAACQAALGRLSAAMALVDEAAAMAPARALPLVADAGIDLALARADLAAARERVEALSGPARAYREAQVARLDGELGVARARLDEAEAGLEGPAGRGAVLGERAEVEALAGRWEAALEAARAAVLAHAAERRRGPLASAVGALVRVAALARVALPVIDAGVGPERPRALAGRLRAEAEARQLRLVALDLDLALALADADGPRLGASIATADALGLRHRAGRARAWGLADELLRADVLPAALADLDALPAWRHLALDLGGDAAARAWLEARGIAPLAG
jgi:hypothetical protein